MNKDNARDYLPLVQALSEGRSIQMRNSDGGWSDYENFDFVCHPDDYRIKPEPREIFVVGNNENLAYWDEDRARDAGTVRGRVVRYREVLE